MSNNAFEALDTLQELLKDLNQILLGSETEDVTIDGVVKPTISKAIQNHFDAIYAIANGNIAYETKADMDAAGAPASSVMAFVWKDPTEANNGLYGWNGSAWEKSDYDMVTKYLELEHVKELVLAGYEADLSGHALISDDGYLIAHAPTTGDKYEILLPLKFTPHPDNPLVEQSELDNETVAREQADTALQAQITDNDTELGALNHLASLLPAADYEIDLCGFSVVSVTDDGYLLHGTGDKLVATGTHWIRYPEGYEIDLCGYVEALLDRNGYLISGEGYLQTTLPTSLATVTGESSAAWVELGVDNSFSLKSFSDKTGQIVTLGSSSTNFNPSVDSEDRVLYVRNNQRYWQRPEGSTEFPFIAPAEIVCYGDSKTAAGSGYGDIMVSTYPEYSPNIQGIGGQRAAQIAARTGGLPIYAQITGDEIPASGSVTLVTGWGQLRNLLGASSTKTIRVSIAGVVGLLQQTNGADYTFTRDVAGSAIKVYPDIPVTVLSGLVYNSDISDLINQKIGIFWLGTNDIGKVDYSEDDVVEYIKASITSQLAYCRRYLVLGVPHMYGWLHTSQGGNETDLATSELKFTQVESLRNRLRREFGNFYVDMTDQHVENNPQFITEYVVDGVTYPVLDATYSTDGIHGNTDGRTADAAIIIDQLTTRGWLS